MSVQDSAKTVDILEKLKSAILNIDWEISDENIAILNNELSALRTAWEGQKVHVIYLQILGAISQYIASSKEQANPGAFPMLRSVFDSLEDMIVNPGDEESQMKNVMVHVDAYNALKKAVSAGTPAPAPAPAPAPEPEPEPAPEPEPEVVETKEVGEEEPSTINRLLNDDEDHSTDSIFDSMLDEMVQKEEPEQEEEPATPPPAPKAPAGRPPVQAAYNKADGKEVEADRNLSEEFAEADLLLDNFFEDDVPHPRAAAEKDGDEFDLGVFAEGEGGVLDLDQVAQEETGGGGTDEGLELELEDTSSPEEAAVLEVAEEQPSVDLDHVEDGELDIFRLDDEETGAEEVPVSESGEVPEIESALDGFFEGEEDEVSVPSAADSIEVSGPAEEILEVDSALDDFFGEEPDETAAEVKIVEQPGAEVVSGSPAGTVAGLKTLLLSVDWEVDDQLFDRVDAEISTLSTNLAGNDVALIHLNFLNIVIHHVSSEQSQVISESMACMKMLTESLEDLLAGEGADETKYAAKAASSFADWHELVVADFEKRQDGTLVDSKVEQMGGESELSVTQKLKEEILTEIREMLSLEMQTIRQELSAKD